MSVDPRPFRRVALVGLGAMGGSLARALGTLDPAPERIGWSPDRAERTAARAAGALERAPEGLAEAVADADLVVLATPLAAACGLVPRLADVLGPAAALSDVASLKAPMAQAVAEAGLTGRWVGAHPMCGSEASGFAASRADLFQGALVHLVFDDAVGHVADRVAALWHALGARTARTAAAEHDTLMAAASHLPQLVANALAARLEAVGLAPSALGPGGLDMTRLAASSPAMWQDLLGAERGVSEHLSALSRALDGLAELVHAGDTEAIVGLMERTRAWRGGA